MNDEEVTESPTDSTGVIDSAETKVNFESIDNDNAFKLVGKTGVDGDASTPLTESTGACIKVFFSGK